MPFRSNMTEGWRSNSGAWVDDNAGEYALVSPLTRGPEVVGLMSVLGGNADA
jgi:hypothetical protein